MRVTYERLKLRAFSTFEHLPEDEMEAGFAEFERDAMADYRIVSFPSSLLDYWFSGVRPGEVRGTVTSQSARVGWDDGAVLPGARTDRGAAGRKSVFPLRTRRNSALLTALLMQANRVVPLPQLIDAIWGDERRLVRNVRCTVPCPGFVARLALRPS